MDAVQDSNIALRQSPTKWLLEGFASRAALLGFIYFSVNVIYQQGYLSRLGIEFGLFSITRTFPVFDNYIIAGYAFLIWGFLIETPANTYDQFFGFFKPRSWRDRKTREYRILALELILLVYIALHAYYLNRFFWTGSNLYTWGTKLNYFRIFLQLLTPSWEFLSWSFTFIPVILLIAFFFLFNRIYRRIRGSALQQTFNYEMGFMQFHINVITPAAIFLGVLLVFLMIPLLVGRLSADLTIESFQNKDVQKVARVELKDVSSFCGEKVIINQDNITWQDNGINNFSIHLLGSINGSDVFVKIETNKLSNTPFTVCIIDPSSIKSIEFPQNTSH